MIPSLLAANTEAAGAAHLYRGAPELITDLDIITGRLPDILAEF